MIMCPLIMCKILTGKNREDIYNSPVSHGLFPGKKERMSLGNKKERWLFFYSAQFSSRVKHGGKCSDGADWLKKILRYCRIQDVRQSHKFHHGSHEKLGIWIDSKRKNLSRCENPAVSSKEMRFHHHYL